ncbi:hypothetical protein POM88_030470 [Heracleum sosnowskyi]|uniref:F-box associated beta-propeller type 1 domain-containing protein n=1 Tax=Heracleum sosnowskyi TaxID=360622 RepID=A0AAD8HXG6_9APIA|nr:hypothetical protein POM88_030470 [Heracleum sosnowskyi]
MCLGFKAGRLNQQQLIGQLPETIIKSISQHLFIPTVQRVYLFQNVSRETLLPLHHKRLKELNEGDLIVDSGIRKMMILKHIVAEPRPERPTVRESCALLLAQNTLELKLLRFYYRGYWGPGQADIQTIGTNTWRSIGEIPDCSVQPVIVNGRCHWLNYRTQGLITSFDPEEEVFLVIKTPPSGVNNIKSNLGVLEGCLCLGLKTQSWEWDIWVMNTYGIQDSWTKKFVVSSITCVVNH